MWRHPSLYVRLERWHVAVPDLRVWFGLTPRGSATSREGKASVQHQERMDGARSYRACFMGTIERSCGN